MEESYHETSGSGVMKKMNEMNVLIGYQFRSPQLDRSEIDKLIIEACKRAQDDLNQGRPDQVTIHPVLLDLLSGGLPAAEILAKISNADLCVFETSDSTPEAFFGLGYAVGQGKPCIYLQHEEQTPSGSPMTLSGVFVLRYDTQTLGDRLAYELYRRASEIIDKRIVEREKSLVQNEELDTFRAFWGLEGEHSVYLVCPEIPENERMPYASLTARDYLRLAKFADLDSLFHLESFLARFFPAIRIFECTCNDMPLEANNENLIVIGGIAWNKLTAQITQSINLPFVQRDGGPGNPDPIDDIRSEERYLPTIAEDGTVQMDIGYFVRIPNPANKKRLLFIVNGILTFGVLGVARSFSEGIQGVENCSHILERMGKSPYFAALLRVPVIYNYAAIPNITRRDVLIELLGYSPERNEFT